VSYFRFSLRDLRVLGVSAVIPAAKMLTAETRRTQRGRRGLKLGHYRNFSKDAELSITVLNEKRSTNTHETDLEFVRVTSWIVSA
jgi:hypothetical protein